MQDDILSTLYQNIKYNSLNFTFSLVSKHQAKQFNLFLYTMIAEQPQNQDSSQNIIYLTRNSDGKIFCSQSLELFNLYKRFVQNTILELGQDWRIESGLLAQQIMAEKSLTNDEFCIFNEFMAGFLRQRLGHEGSQLQIDNKKIFSEQQGQQQFLKYFNKNFSKNGFPTNSDMQPSSNDYSSNLTFKTLSLGFYIMAGDIWSKTFKKYHKECLGEKLNNINITHQNKLRYFATLDVKTSQWMVCQEQQIHTLLTSYDDHVDPFASKSQQSLSKAIKLGSVVVNVSQTVIKDQKQSSEVIVRVFSLCRQFYFNMFLVWLIFSIKKSFNSSLFSPVCYLRYCDIIIGSKIFANNQVQFTTFHSIYRQFKLLCDNQWKNLMKDYMIALNDDKEVLKTLVKRIGQKIEERFTRQISGKKEKITNPIT